MKIFKRICLLLLIFISAIPSVIQAEGIYTFIGKHPSLSQRAAATVYHVGECSAYSEQQIIFLKFNEILIKISGDYYTEIKLGDEIIGKFNNPNIQEFYIARTRENFDGQVLCKRIPTSALPTINENNTYISGSNNTYSDNETIKGNNNISRNNIYIGGSNNTITGNTHHQGSNNVYENNVIIGGSNSTRTDTETYGASNRVVKGQVIDRSGSDSSSNSYSSDKSKTTTSPTSSQKSKKDDSNAWIGVLVLIFCIYTFWIYKCSAKGEFWHDFMKISLEAISPILSTVILMAIIGIPIYLLAEYTFYTVLTIIGFIITWFIYEAFRAYPQIKKEQEDAARRKIEWEQQKQKEQEKHLAYKKEQERISTLPIHYVGNKESGKYHHCNCVYARKMYKSKKEYFESAGDAEQSGYIPCSICKPSTK